MNKRSFFSKYFTNLLVIFFLSLFSVGFFSTWTIVRFSNRDTANRLEEYVKVMAYFLPKEGFSSHEDAQLFVNSGAHAENLRVTLIDRDGLVLADSHAPWQNLDNHNDRREILLARQYGSGFSRRYSNTLKEMYIYSALFHENSGTVLRLSMAVSNIQQKAMRSYLWVTLITLSILTITILISYTQAQSVSVMLNSLKITADNYAAGDFSRSLCLSGFKEAHELSVAVNSMGSQLQEKINQITDEKEKTQAMFNQMSEPVLNLNRNLNILEANRAALEMAGLQGNSWKGKNLIQIFRSKKLCKLAEKVLSTQESHSKMIYWKEQNRYLQVGVSFLQKRGDEENPSLLMVMNDVTEIKRLELMRRDFVGNVSHELRTPVTSILGYAHTLMMRDKLTEEQVDEFITIIQKQGKRLALIIDDLLTLSALEEEGDSLITKPCSVGGLVEKAVLFCQLRAQQFSVQFQYNLCHVEEIQAYPSLLEQALTNLIDNAIKYGPSGGIITISTIVNDDNFEFHIKDNGPGIPLDKQDRLFERFYRTDKARSRDAGGTGLGLAIVKHIAQKHQGNVGLQSQWGAGSDFYISLPLNPAKQD